MKTFTICLFSTLVIAADREVVLQSSFQGRPVPTWHNGFITGVTPDRQKVELYSANGGRLATLEPKVSGASSFQIRNVTVRGNGEAAVALSARDSAGRAANVLVFFASTGQQLREVSTGDFAGRVLFGPDDTLWAWGRRHDAQLESVNDHGVVRRYDANGLLRGESVSSASFGLAERSHVTADSMFAARRGQAVLVSWTANTAVWVDSNGKELRRQQLPQLSPGEFASGVSLSSNGGLIFSLQGRETARFVGLEQGATAWRPLPSLAGYAIVGTEADVPVTYGAGKMMVAQSLGASER